MVMQFDYRGGGDSVAPLFCIVILLNFYKILIPFKPLPALDLKCIALFAVWRLVAFIAWRVKMIM